MGRDIIWDQNYKYNLAIRRTLEHIYTTYSGNRGDEQFQHFVTYLKRIWFANGIHHHYAMDKMKPGFSPDYLKILIKHSDAKGFAPEFSDSQEVEEFLRQQLFDEQVAAKRVVLDDGVDIIAASANNFYEGVTQQEAEAFYDGREQPYPEEPVSLGLNSKLVKEEGRGKRTHLENRRDIRTGVDGNYPMAEEST
ncbi:MAG: hypothetical protein U5L09_03035 [Bacteroidales bacterium]|nr:hypothetical protein [Bacteroidales bacterium]